MRASAARAAGTALAMALALGVIVAVGGVLALPAVFRLMEATGEVAVLGREFLVVQLLGAVLIYGYFVVTAAFRSAGDTRTPFVLLGGSVLFNLVLDPIMILGWGPVPALGVYGAALATVLTRGLGFIVGIELLRRRGGIRLAFSGQVARTIARIGLPTMLTGVLFSMIYMLLVRYVGQFGTSAIAALGVGHKIEGISYMICIGFGLAAETLVGQNLGAGRPGARAPRGMAHRAHRRGAGLGARGGVPADTRDAGRRVHRRPGGRARRFALPPRGRRRPARDGIRDRARGRAHRCRVYAADDDRRRRHQRAPNPAGGPRVRPVRTRRDLVDARAHRHRARRRDDVALAMGRVGAGARLSGTQPSDRHGPLPLSMSAITLLTDFGTTDSYVAEVKGVLLGICPDAVLVDVTHAVQPGDVRAGAYLLGRAWSRFPRGTVHLVVVDPGVGTARAALALGAHGHWFVGPDNGLFTPVLRDAQVEIVTLPLPPSASPTFHGRDLFAPAAAIPGARHPAGRAGAALPRDARAADLRRPALRGKVCRG